MEFTVSGTAAENYGKLKSKVNQYLTDGKLGFVKDVNFEDATHTLKAAGSGFKAQIQCKDNLVQVDLDLNLIMKAMRGQIEGQLGSLVKKIFG